MNRKPRPIGKKSPPERYMYCADHHPKRATSADFNAKMGSVFWKAKAAISC